MADHSKAVREENLLFLTDDQLLQGIELMFFAYKGFTSDPDQILQNYTYGRAHHRALHFVQRNPNITVSALLDILGVTKQSLNRVLRQLVNDQLIESSVGKKDRRERNLQLTQTGQILERSLSEAQRKRMRAAYKAAGPDAVHGFRTVLKNIMDPQMNTHLDKA